MDRPVVFDFDEPVKFIAAMLKYRKLKERNFSVLQACKSLRRVSPALVTQVVQGKRRLTLDRINEFAKLCRMTPREKIYLLSMLEASESKSDQRSAKRPDLHLPKTMRKEVSTHILKDWLNIYVKDAFRIKQITKNQEAIYELLGGIASRSRIDRCIRFLLREGYLKRDENHQIIEDAPLMSASGDGTANRDIRRFHKSALSIAREAIDIYSTDQRFANALVLPLNDESYEELVDFLTEVSEKLQAFAEKWSSDDKRLYQIVINLSPTGGSLES